MLGGGSGLMGMMATGAAFGAGSAVGHAAVGSLMGGGGGHGGHGGGSSGGVQEGGQAQGGYIEQQPIAAAEPQQEMVLNEQ